MDVTTTHGHHVLGLAIVKEYVKQLGGTNAFKKRKLRRVEAIE